MYQVTLKTFGETIDYGIVNSFELDDFWNMYLTSAISLDSFKDLYENSDDGYFSVPSYVGKFVFET